MNCKSCNNPIPEEKLKHKPKYCNSRCYGNYLKLNPSPTSFQKKENHWNYKGGKTTHRGYVYVLQPDHPHADPSGYVREHRLVMEKHLGRYLEPDEVVHHIDEDRSNNDIENLELTDRIDHLKKHDFHRDHMRGGVNF